MNKIKMKLKLKTKNQLGRGTLNLTLNPVGPIC